LIDLSNFATLNKALLKPHFEFCLNSEMATDQLAAALAHALIKHQAAPLLIFLRGELGAGKTFFTRALIGHLGFAGRVKSPTFTLMEPYHLPAFAVFHFDFYRFEGGSDWRDAGFEEYLPGTGVAIVEWPNKATGLPQPDIDLLLTYGEIEHTRVASLTANSSKAQALLADITVLPIKNSQA
jgi:tRNA threonylcarbamoyladenosine biosynthesis protein TsaE